jgi:undecaprenyl diphosphate synthase
VQKDATPHHIGLILDGNRRWAKANGKRSYTGHKRGADLLKELSIGLFDKGTSIISAFVFSTDNWKRKSEEVDYLMRLFLKLVDSYLTDFRTRNVKIKILGSRENLSPQVLEAIVKAESQTVNNTGGTLALCFNYGGRQEIVEATKKLLASGTEPADVSEELLSRYMYGPEIPDVDLLIRTSGEQRLSGYMLWRSTYAELAFIDKHWPDMTLEDFDKVLVDFATRKRRFGC